MLENIILPELTDIRTATSQLTYIIDYDAILTILKLNSVPHCRYRKNNLSHTQSSVYTLGYQSSTNGHPC